MNVQEFDTALSDLETRVDRLRALYENWFRGYEKMEPAVARKDVERRVYGLRKELPRNTALRFRYNQLYQRYTTLATYWQRTARQIEEGTHRLQLKRLQRRRNEDDVQRTNIPPDFDDEVTIPPPAYELNLEESLDVNQLLEEADMDQLARSIQRSLPGSTPMPARPAAAPPPPSTPVPVNIASARFSRPSVANDNVAPNKVVLPPGAPRPAAELQANAKLPPPAPGTGTMKMPPAGGAPARNAALASGKAAATNVPTSGKPAATNAPPPGAKPPQPPPPGAAKPPLKIPVPNAPSTGTMPGLPNPRVSIQPSAPVAGAMPPPAAARERPSSPGTGTLPLPGRPTSTPDAARSAASATRPPMSSGTVPRPPALGATPGTAASPAVDAARPAASAPSPGARAAQTSGTVPSVGARIPSAPAQSGTAQGNGTSGVRAEPPASAPPLAARPVAPRAPVAPSPRPAAPAPPSAASSGSLNEQRMRRIYDEYAAARRKNNEGDVRYEALASTIQKMLPDLHKKHQGKQIDFEVVLKDGRVGLKPKAT